MPAIKATREGNSTMGARVIGTISATPRRSGLQALGADHVISCRAHPDWHRIMRDHTGGAGADHVLELGGAAGLARSILAAALGGDTQLVGSHPQDNTTASSG